MKAIWLAALLCVVGMAHPWVQAQTSEAARKATLEYQTKAKQGVPEAQYNLGNSCNNGQGVEKDLADAFGRIHEHFPGEFRLLL